MIQQDLKGSRLKKNDTGDRNKWRRRIHAAGPSHGGISSSLKEIEIAIFVNSLYCMHHKMNNGNVKLSRNVLISFLEGTDVDRRNK